MPEERFRELIKDKRILVTGGTGSIGRQIVRTLLDYDPKVIRVLSRDPAKQAALAAELGPLAAKVRFIVGDIRDADRLMMSAEDINIIFHAAAFKYVPEGEYNPFEVVQTNVIGTQNLINAALKTPSVTHVVMISTDKAASPASTMGASKLLAERLVSAAHYIRGSKQKIFTTVRFGNVIGSSGSVLPIFLDNIRRGQSLVVTHPEMTRFFMTIPDAVRLVFSAAALAYGGEIFVLKMPSVAIQALAEVCVERYARGPVSVTQGMARPGENIHEALLTPSEARAALENDSLYIIVPQIEIGDITFKDRQYPNARPLATEHYTTAVAPKLPKPQIPPLA